MARPESEMPFLDHLEELRWRLLWTVLALVIGVFVAFVLLVKVDVIGLLQSPIKPYLHGRKLVYTHPGDTFSIVLNAAIALGVVFSLPVMIWQAWSFLAPALYQHEKKIVVPVFAGAIGLFLAGASMCYFFALPVSLDFLLGFQSESLEPMITAGEYFSFAISMTLAFGAAFELPIVILALAALGVVTPQFLGKYRRHAIVGCVVAATVLTPGDLVYASAMMAVPLYLLYEVSIWLSWLVVRRRARRQAMAESAAA